MPIQSVTSITTLDLFATAILAGFLIPLVLIDLRDLRLPDRLTLPLIGIGLALGAIRTGGWPVDGAAGAALGYAAFWLIGEAFFRLRGVDGLGRGDAKFLAAAGAWLGPAALPWLVLIAAAAGLTVVLAKSLIQGRKHSSALAFGPWLAAAFWAIWLFELVSAN